MKHILRWILFPVALLCTGLGGLSCASTRPDTVGLKAQRLAPCAGPPNCVCSLDQDAQHAIAALPDNWPALLQAVHALPRARIVTERADYLHVEIRSRLFRFVDDLEFYRDANAGQIQVRSAARSGYSDMGVNRKRIESLRERLAEQG